MPAYPWPSATGPVQPQWQADGTWPGQAPHEWQPNGMWAVPPQQQAQPVKPSALPVVQREYHEFFRAPRFRWWRPVLAIAMFVATWFLATLLISIPPILIDVGSGRLDMAALARGELKLTPLLFLANNLGLAVAIPLAGLTAWAVFGQRPRWMSSIAGRFRWGLFWRFVAVAVPILLASVGVEILLGGPPQLVWNADSWFLIISILLTTPLQAAGEEYGTRGLLARSIGSWFGSARVGLVVATVITSVVFMLLHGAGDPWLNGYYFTVGVACSILVWKTGGLEAAIALHVVNNLIGEVTIPFGGLEGMFNREAGAAGPEILVQVFFTLALVAALLVVARRLRIPQSAAPAAVQQELP
ncbi:MAG TPA: type II CAAX endopeptidase family protein [Propionicimonas sp.]|uniref:CPBP family intramembrane glutamic endopeptidase n=1 Tax=Propionicimonas sp. TaxID=1955623 RepID=UPI002F3FF4E1